MRGHQALIDMRRRGGKPETVFIDTDASDKPLPRWAQWQESQPGLCEIDITPSEPAQKLDLRPLVGLTVYVHGTDPQRVRSIAGRAKEAEASRVIACCLQRIEYGGEVAFRTVWIEDTDNQFEGENNGARAA